MVSTDSLEFEMAAESETRDKWRKQYGPWAIVTGASEGIGRAIAADLAQRGLNLVLVARREDRLQSLASEFERAHQVQCRIVAIDLGKREAVSVLLQETELLDVGLVAACAGYGTSGRFLDIPIANELDMLDVNCRAVLEMTYALGRRLAYRGKGGIILISSIVAFQGVQNAANYAATKAYIQTLAEGITDELATQGVEVLVATPGPVESGFAGRARMMMGKAADPALVARETLNALGKSRSVRPGLLAKILIGSLSTLPRFGRRIVMGQIMKGFTRHHERQS
jgi:short-subunit dehydrogenase